MAEAGETKGYTITPEKPEIFCKGSNLVPYSSHTELFSLKHRLYRDCIVGFSVEHFENFINPYEVLRAE